MSIKDMPDKLAVQCWHGVEDAIGWDGYVRDGQPHPLGIIASFIDQAFADGYETGKDVHEYESAKELRKRLSMPERSEEAQTKTLQMNIFDLIK